MIFSGNYGPQLQPAPQAAYYYQRAPGTEPGTPGGFPRSESMMSGVSMNSAIIAESEKIRQRYKKLWPKEVEEDDKDYKTNVQSLSFESLRAIFKTKFSDDGTVDGETGLREEQAKEYFKFHGKNEITPPPKENKWIALLKQVFLDPWNPEKSIFNILLWACVAAEVTLLIVFSRPGEKKEIEDTPEGKEDEEGEAEGDYVTPIILSAVIVLAAVLQWYAEQQAQLQMEGLAKMASAAKVPTWRRSNGQTKQVDLDPTTLVPGDVIKLKDGDRIPADVRILSCTDGMEVDNSALTGESVPEARTNKTQKMGTAPTESTNLAYYGTTVLKGNATCLVHATGDKTYLGKIAQSILSSRQQSTLEQQIEHFVHIIAVVAIVIGLLSLAANLLSSIKRSPADILQNAAAALFAQVPEGLLPTVTISLMIAGSEMKERQVLVRKIDAIETLGCVTVFCSDKTGTLTKGEMTLQDIVIPKNGKCSNGMEVFSREKTGEFQTAKENKAIEAITLAGCLNNASTIRDEPGAKWAGSPTEVAIMDACAKCQGGLTSPKQLIEKPENKKLFEIPFNSENKWMLTVHGDRNKATVYLKGAPDRVLKFTTVNNDQAGKTQFENQLTALMKDARRCLAIAKKELGPGQVPPKLEGTTAETCNFDLTNFELLGLYGIEDPPKAKVDTAVVKAHDAGIKVVMVTGDHPETARAIAKRINILGKDEPPLVDGEDFTVITGDRLEKRVPKGDQFEDDEPHENVEWWTNATKHARVFARVSPIHKQVIVYAYQRYGNGHVGDICAMTGDGVNDAPALKAANVGVAMGIRGTEVAKDAADIVLLNDDFSNIVDGIEQGRLSSENLQKSIMYTLCSKVPQVAPTFAELLSIPPALTVAQVLLIDIGTDIWTAIAYALQPAESKLMERKPRHPKLEKLVNGKVLVYSYGYIGMLQMTFCWLMFFHAVPGIMKLYTDGKTANDWTKEERAIDTRGMTVYYWTLVLGQIAAAISTTTKMQSVFGLGGTPYCFPNMTLNFMFVLEIALGLAAIYVPFMWLWFETGILELNSVLMPISALVGICLIEEIRKLIARRMEDAGMLGNDKVASDEEASSSEYTSDGSELSAMSAKLC